MKLNNGLLVLRMLRMKTIIIFSSLYYLLSNGQVFMRRPFSQEYVENICEVGSSKKQTDQLQ